MERTGDLRGECGAAADENGEHHRDGGERREVDGNGVSRSQGTAGRGQRDERQDDEDHLAVLEPGLRRVALEEEREHSGDEPSPDKKSDRAAPVVSLIRETERAQLLDLEGGHDVAVADDDLARGHLYLNRGHAVSRVLLREARGELIDFHVHVQVLLEDLRPRALLPVGPTRRQGLQRVRPYRVKLFGTNPLGIERSQWAFEASRHLIPLRLRHVHDVGGNRWRKRDLRNTGEGRDLLIAGLRRVGADPSDRARRARDPRARIRDDGRVRRELLRHRGLSLVSLCLGQRLRDARPVPRHAPGFDPQMGGGRARRPFAGDFPKRPRPRDPLGVRKGPGRSQGRAASREGSRRPGLRGLVQRA